jgi:hypothetical protein
MGCVDNGGDALARQKRRQALGAAEAADALRNWRLSGICRRSGERQDRRDIGLVSKPSRKRAGFRRPAENEQAKSLQWAAP